MDLQSYHQVQKELNSRIDRLIAAKGVLATLQVEALKELSDLHKNWKDMPSPE